MRNVKSYDRPLYETVSGGSPTGTLGYGYDDVGNRTSRTGTLGSLTASNNTFDLNDWVSGVAFDANGNSRTNGSIYYGYDWANRLTSQTNGAAVVSVAYGADGNRIQRTSASATNLYLVATVNPTGYPQVVEDFTASAGTTNLSSVYAYGLGLISQRQANGTVSFFGTDGLGSTRFLTSTNGTITDTYAYDAFGTLIASTGSTPNNYLFNGQQSDSTLGGLLYLRQRYNIPSLGRFLTRDGLPGNNQDPLSLHKYLYAESNPVNAVDPSGEVTILSNWMYGQKLHDRIGDNFTLMTGGVYNQPVSGILGIPWIPYLTASKPDLVLKPSMGSPGEVYEIKPVGSFIQGRVQLQFYLTMLNTLDPQRRTWQAGSIGTYTPPTVIPLSWGVYAFVSPPVNGVILYYIEDLRIDILCIAVYMSTQLKLDLAEATLVNTLAPVY